MNQKVIPPNFKTEGELRAWHLGFEAYDGRLPRNPFPKAHAPKAREAWAWGWMSASVAAEKEKTSMSEPIQAINFFDFIDQQSEALFAFESMPVGSITITRHPDGSFSVKTTESDGYEVTLRAPTALQALGVLEGGEEE